MKFKKKKSFWKEFFNECAGVILAGAIMIYIALSAIMGNLILSYINNGKEINPYIEDVSGKFTIFLIKTTIGGMYLFGIIFALLIAFAIIGIIVIAIVTGITHITAVKRYTYLPLTADELRLKINKESIFKNPADYIKYICEQMRYYSESTNEYKSLKLTMADLLTLCRTYEEVYEDLIVFKYEDYKYFNRFNKAFPFEFKTFENTYIKSDDILDKISDKEIVIFCSDKTLAEAYLSGYKGQAVIYYVKDKLLTKSID